MLNRNKNVFLSQTDLGGRLLAKPWRKIMWTDEYAVLHILDHGVTFCYENRIRFKFKFQNVQNLLFYPWTKKARVYLHIAFAVRETMTFVLEIMKPNEFY